MAESADILARPGQATILPDLNAGCSMADMAENHASGRLLGKSGPCRNHQMMKAMGSRRITLHEFRRLRSRHFVASAPAWFAPRLTQPGLSSGDFEKTQKLLFLPDQHLGRNTGYKLGIPLNEMVCGTLTC